MVNVNKEQRTIYLCDDINSSSVSTVVNFLVENSTIDDIEESKQKNYCRKPFHLFVQSYGGAIDDMWALIDTINSIKTPVYTYCFGYAFSAGFIVFISGKKRFMGEHSKIMCHQMSCGTFGELKIMEEDIDRFKEIQKTIEKYILSKTDMTQEMLDKIKAQKMNVYFNYKTAKSLNMVDDLYKGKLEE